MSTSSGFVGPTGGGSGGTVSGTFPTASAIAKAVEIEAGDNFVVGVSNVDGRALILRSQADNDATTVTELDGTTPAAASEFTPGLASVDKEVLPYVADLATGTYTLANLIALVVGSTSLVSFHVFISTGTASITTNGSTMLLPTTSSFERPTTNGQFLGDFTLTIDAASTAKLHLEGMA